MTDNVRVCLPNIRRPLVSRLKVSRSKQKRNHYTELLVAPVLKSLYLLRYLNCNSGNRRYFSRVYILNNKQKEYLVCQGGQKIISNYQETAEIKDALAKHDFRKVTLFFFQYKVGR